MSIFADNEVKITYDNNIVLCCSNISCIDETKKNNICLDSCCIKNNIYFIWQGINFNSELSKKKKISNKSYFLTKNYKNTIHLNDFKNLSPPYFNKKINNYFYHNLIKIIKSNT